MESISKNVLVTGAAKRLGRAIALELAECGWSIAVHHKQSHKEAAETAAAIREKGVRAFVLAADLGQEDDVARLIGQAESALGPLGALVNNASIFEHDDIANMTRESWDMHMAVNLRAPILLAQKFSEHLSAKEQGVIVNLLDQRVCKPTPEFLSYGVTKAGLHWLTTTLAQALSPHIRVNAVAPGPTLPSARQSKEQFERQSSSTLLGHGASPEDIAAAVRYLIEAGSVTGQTIVVDGGQHLAWRSADAVGLE
jgi:NAD(P)-dependent dehydrogenase (short-subunit alcohol dehydrogenase family)